MDAPKIKIAVLTLCVALTLALALIFAVLSAKTNSEQNSSPFDKSVRLSFKLNNESRDFIESFKLTSYLPVNVSDYQTLVNVHSSAEHSIARSEIEGHGDIEILVRNLPPFGHRVINFTATVQGYDSPKYESIDESEYLAEDQYVELESPEVLRVVDELRQNHIDQPEAIYQWVRDNVKDSGYVAKNKGAKYALTERRGDCTEYMYAFVALARANGIPARGVAGFFVEGDASLVASSDYHNWAEYHDGDKWVLVDPYKGYFDESYKNYIAFRFIGVGAENQSGLSASRFMSVDERVSVNL